MKKKVIFSLIIAIFLVSAFLVLNYNNLNKNINNNSELSMYIIDGEGKETKIDAFPTEGNYILDEKSKCENGSTLEWDNETKKVIVTGNKKDFCNLYFKVQETIEYATLVNGETFNAKIKQLAGDDGATADTTNTNIKYIEFLGRGEYPGGYNAETINELPNVNISTDEDKPVMAYFGPGYGDYPTIFIYSKYKIAFNANSSAMFRKFTGIRDISFNNTDTSNVTNMSNMFEQFNMSNSNESVLWLDDFDTSNVTNMNSMFSSSYIIALRIDNFDTSKVTDMSYMFANSLGLQCIYNKNAANDNLNPLADKVTHMYDGVTVRPNTDSGCGR